MVQRPPLRDGLDRVGPFHPYVAFAAVLLVDLFIVMLFLGMLAYLGDKVEDAIWPGGDDWVEF